MKNKIILIFALIGCFYLSIIAHEVRHLFQEEYTDICFSIKDPIAHVYHKDKLYYFTAEEYAENEFEAVLWGWLVLLLSSHYVLQKFEVI